MLVNFISNAVGGSRYPASRAAQTTQSGSAVESSAISRNSKAASIGDGAPEIYDRARRIYLRARYPNLNASRARSIT